MNKHQFNFGGPKFIQVLYSIAEKEGILQQVLLRTPEVKDEWHNIKDNACEKGTKFHLHQEQDAYEKGFMKTNPKDITNKVIQIVDSKPIYINPNTITTTRTGPDGNSDKPKPQGKYIEDQKISESTLKLSAKDLYLLPDGYYPELIIWNDKYTVCGTADKVWINTIDGVRFIDIDDWKTNKEIKMPTRYNMEAPLGHLSDVNYIHYTLQLSTYAWMLEQVGFTIRNLYLTHQREINGESTRYKLQYLKKEVLLMLNHKK